MKNAIILLFLIFLFQNCTPTETLPLPTVSSGKIERLENFQSNWIAPRNIDIWLPAGYDEKKSYAVLYMHDGQMLFDATKTWNKQEWGVDEISGKLMLKNAVQDFIVVGIWNTKIDTPNIFLKNLLKIYHKIFEILYWKIHNVIQIPLFFLQKFNPIIIKISRRGTQATHRQVLFYKG